MHLALYRKFRPETFDALFGQEHIVRILKNQIANGTTSHAYLFTGTRGTGKTTVARLLAKGLNCKSDLDKPCGKCEACMDIKNGSYMDVIEIDAASNTGVEDIRELRESVKYPPALGPYKVYIIDEVHMISKQAFNALLKTLEEPPENVVFILATTEPEKLPATIISRCLRLDFKRVGSKILTEGLSKIADEIGVTIEPDALALLVNNADGSVRDALSLMDQAVAGNQKVTRDDLVDLLGAVNDDAFFELTGFLIKHDINSALVRLNELLAAGKDERQVMRGWIEYYRSLLLAKCVKEPEKVLTLGEESLKKVSLMADYISLDDINSSIEMLAKSLNDSRYTTYPRILLELFIIQKGEKKNG